MRLSSAQDLGRYVRDRRRASDLGMADRVHFRGALPASEVAAVLAAADVYVQLSRHEGFPLSIVEALLAAKPAVLSSAIGTVSYPEVARLPHVMVVPPRASAASIGSPRRPRSRFSKWGSSLARAVPDSPNGWRGLRARPPGRSTKPHRNAGP